MYIPVGTKKKKKFYGKIGCDQIFKVMLYLEKIWCIMNVLPNGVIIEMAIPIFGLTNPKILLHVAENSIS